MSSKRRRSRKPTGNTKLPPPDEFAKQVVELIGEEQAAQLRRDMEYVMERAKSPLWRKVFQDCGDPEYADAICTYLAMAVSNSTNYSSQFNSWDNQGERLRGVFGRQGIPVVWDYAEANPFMTFDRAIEKMARVLERLPADTNTGMAYQALAQEMNRMGR